MSYAVLLESLAEEAGSAVKFDDGLMGTQPPGPSFHLHEFSEAGHGHMVPTDKVEKFTVAVIHWCPS